MCVMVGARNLRSLKNVDVKSDMQSQGLVETAQVGGQNCKCESTKVGIGLKSLYGRKRRKRKTTKGVPVATTLSGT